MDKEIQANLLLEADNLFDLLLDELLVLLGCKLAFTKLKTSRANLLRLLWSC